MLRKTKKILEKTKKDWAVFTNNKEPYEIPYNTTFNMDTQLSYLKEDVIFNLTEFTKIRLNSYPSHIEFTVKDIEGIPYSANTLSLEYFKNDLKYRLQPVNADGSLIDHYLVSTKPMKGHKSLNMKTGDLQYPTLNKQDTNLFMAGVDQVVLTEKKWLGYTTKINQVSKISVAKNSAATSNDAKQAIWRFKKLQSFYINNLTPFTVDLVRAVLRQLQFAKKNATKYME